ncbi:DUF6345 domain-containing protein [Tumebacillus lipolyticus]|uniref:DUF6345 domain-containing protein n=1 Tax=Tumebacillus lipolyticus TaxID=1280370 RepID=A0ABW4ZWN8_9BACL
MNRKKQWTFGSVVFLVAATMTADSVSAGGTFTVLGVSKYDAPTMGNLDNDDAYVFRNNLLSNSNWSLTKEFYDSNVWDTDFVNYGNKSDILMFTGHGSILGRLCLAQYRTTNPNPRINYVDWNTIGSQWIGWDDTVDHDLEWAVFMSCDDLVQNGWGRTLANGVHHIFGYKGISYETKDDSVINSFQIRFMGINRTPETMINAWINANVLCQEPNWAITGHKGNERDYFHFVSTGATADISGTSDIYHWSGAGSYYLDVSKSGSMIKDVEEKNRPLGKLKIKHEKLDYTKLLDKIFKGKFKELGGSEFGSIVYSDGLSDLSVYPSGAILFETRGNSLESVNFGEETAVKKAEEFINEHGGLPSDALLKEVIPFKMVQQEGNQEQVYAYQIKYQHNFEGVPISGEMGDAITLLVDNSGIRFYFRNWTQVDSKVENSIKDSINEERVIELAKKNLPKKMKGIAEKEIEFRNVELVYWSKPFMVDQEELSPAWKVSTNQGDIYIDAHNGQILDEEPLLKASNRFVIDEDSILEGSSKK